MDFRQLEYFTAVVEAGSVSAAAKRLAISQPPLSTSITKLETELGVRLLTRTAKGVQPTEAGLYLLRHGSRLLAQRSRITDTMALMGEGLIGELRIGVEPMVVNEFIADVLAEFLDDAPDARIRLVDTTPDAIVQAIHSGDLDMGCIPFGPDRFAEFVSDMCDWTEIVDLELTLAVPVDRVDERHSAGRGWGRWIVPRPLPAFTGMPEVVGAALGSDPSFEVLEVSTPQTALPFVAAGLGVAPITARMAERQSGVAVVPPPGWLHPMQATLLWRKGAEITPLMERWIGATRTTVARTSP